MNMLLEEIDYRIMCAHQRYTEPQCIIMGTQVYAAFSLIIRMEFELVPGDSSAVDPPLVVKPLTKYKGLPIYVVPCHDLLELGFEKWEHASVQGGGR